MTSTRSIPSFGRKPSWAFGAGGSGGTDPSARVTRVHPNGTAPRRLPSLIRIPPTSRGPGPSAEVCPPPPDEGHWLDYMDTPPPPDTPLARWPVGARVDRLVNLVFDIWAPATVIATSPSGTHSIRFVHGGDDEDGVEGWDLRARRDSPSHSPERRDISPRTTS